MELISFDEDNIVIPSKYKSVILIAQNGYLHWINCSEDYKRVGYGRGPTASSGGMYDTIYKTSTRTLTIGEPYGEPYGLGLLFGLDTLPTT